MLGRVGFYHSLVKLRLNHQIRDQKATIILSFRCNININGKVQTRFVGTSSQQLDSGTRLVLSIFTKKNSFSKESEIWLETKNGDWHTIFNLFNRHEMPLWRILWDLYRLVINFRNCWKVIYHNFHTSTTTVCHNFT